MITRCIVGTIVLLAFICATRSAHAECFPYDPAFDAAVAEGSHAKALNYVLHDLRIPDIERSNFIIVPGLSVTEDDPHALSDPDDNRVQIDPALFLEGKWGACQSIVHEWDHLQRFRRDKIRLHRYYLIHEVYPNQWARCDNPVAAGMLASKAEEAAYDCLEDNALLTHADAYEIGAVLAQAAVAGSTPLREDDRNYLIDHLKEFKANMAKLNDVSDEGYYLAEMKREDRDIFCQGAYYLEDTEKDRSFTLGCPRSVGKFTP